SARLGRRCHARPSTARRPRWVMGSTMLLGTLLALLTLASRVSFTGPCPGRERRQPLHPRPRPLRPAAHAATPTWLPALPLLATGWTRPARVARHPGERPGHCHLRRRARAAPRSRRDSHRRHPGHEPEISHRHRRVSVLRDLSPGARGARHSGVYHDPW